MVAKVPDNGLNITDLAAADDFSLTSDGAVINFGADGEVTLTHVADAGLALSSAGNLDTLSLISTDADANAGPNLRLYRNSSSPADSDLLGVIQFEGRNDNSQDFIGVQWKSGTSDVSDGTEDAEMITSCMIGGTLTEMYRIAGGSAPGIIFNEGSADLDFRVESNGNTHMLHVDAGSDIVGIGADPDLGVGLHIKSADTSGSVSTNADELVIEGTRSGMTFLAANDNFSYINFGDDGAADRGTIRYGHSADSFSFQTAATEAMVIDSAGIVTKPLQPAFGATVTMTNIPLTTLTTMTLSERFDTNADLASNTFTAPVTGKYYLGYHFYLTSLDGDHSVLDVKIITSNKTHSTTYKPESTFSGDVNFGVTGSQICDMDANDTATFGLYIAGGAAQTDVHGDSTCSGMLIG